MKEQQRKHLAEHTHPCMCILALIHTFSGPNSASTHEDNRYSPTIHHPRLPHDHMTTVSRVSRVLTPANEQVCGEVAVLGEDHEHQQVVQVQPLHQQPEVVGSHAVLHEHLHHPAARQSLGSGVGGQGSGIEGLFKVAQHLHATAVCETADLLAPASVY